MARRMDWSRANATRHGTEAADKATWGAIPKARSGSARDPSEAQRNPLNEGATINRPFQPTFSDISRLAVSSAAAAPDYSLRRANEVGNGGCRPESGFGQLS